MNTAVVTGSCGLVGFSACHRLLGEGWRVAGIDNDRRAAFFGKEASTNPFRSVLENYANYTHHNCDIRSPAATMVLRSNTDLIIHCAAQPSHDWATSNIDEDFSINAIGTLNLLQAWKHACPKSPFIHVSTSKVYGDNPNRVPLIELPTRWDLPREHSLWNGIPETFSVDQCLHSFFGVSKLSGDLLAQEFGNHFGMPVGVFRPGCITGGNHKGAELHGFLQYMMACVYNQKKYRIFGYQGKQVRCNIHADDLVDAFLTFANAPTPGGVYNMGGRGLSLSLLEALRECEIRCGKSAITEYVPTPRTGDHQWWISDCSKFEKQYGWRARHTISGVLDDVYYKLVNK